MTDGNTKMLFYSEEMNDSGELLSDLKVFGFIRGNILKIINGLTSCKVLLGI